MTDSPVTHHLAQEAETGLAAAADAVAAGECVVLPTDTVYGIGADAFSAAAVQKLLEAKQRGHDMPPPVLIAETSMLRALASDVPADAMALARAHWPGALTLILKTQRTLRLEIGETGGTVAVRVPDNDRARDLLRRTGPLAVSSANIHGHPAAITCEAARDMLGDTVAFYLDDGPTGEQGASTIVDFTGSEHGRVLRQGALPLAVLRATVPSLESSVEPDQPAPVVPPEALALPAAAEQETLGEVSADAAELSEPPPTPDDSSPGPGRGLDG